MPSDIVCFSHLRWNFVCQRPNHLLTRAARDRRVFFVEEPLDDGIAARLDLERHDGVTVATPHLPADFGPEERGAALRALIDGLLLAHGVSRPTLWYYTPMAVPWTDHIEPSATVYDCMDELGNFAGAPADLRQHEHALLDRADVVFTGGHALHEVKRDRHANVHCFPSSVDRSHFSRARSIATEPPDQASIRGPRLGYFGVIDERLDLELIDGIAERRPDWNIVLVGPVAKVDPESLPRRTNIHYLGPKPYEELPAYLAGWDVAVMPFARNEATRYISPTKTPEYLAGGRPVVSTSIRDVVEPYGRLGLAHIADDADAFVSAAERAMQEDHVARVRKVDAFLADRSWDATWAAMAALIEPAPLATGVAVAQPRARVRPAAVVPALAARRPLAAPVGLAVGPHRARS